MYRIVLPLLALLATIAQAAPRDSSLLATRFSLNGTYGFATKSGPVRESGSQYYLIAFRGESSRYAEFDVVDSVWSLIEPQLCDSDAVTLVHRSSEDSSMLLVADFDPMTPTDTILKFPVRGRFDAHGGSCPTEGDQVFNLVRHLFYRPDSTLFWVVPLSFRGCWERGEVSSDGRYVTRQGCMSCGFPVLGHDLSRVFYTGPTYSPGRAQSHTELMAYEFRADTSYLVRILDGVWRQPWLTASGDTIFAVRCKYQEGCELCAITDTGSKPVFKIEYPAKIVGYDVFNHSIVIRTTLGPSTDFRVDRHNLPR